MNVLLIGSGGREHALAWKLSQSPLLDQLICLPGNPGTSAHGTNLPGDPLDLPAVLQAVRQHHIDLAVIGPEDPLAAGLADALRQAGILVYGPGAAAARLESSKAFAKDFMARHRIPTAVHQTFSEFEPAWRDYQARAAENPLLPVIKASGLAAGKGVFLPTNLAEAEQNLRAILVSGQFGQAGRQVVIEDRLQGREVSLLAFCDGQSIVPMIPAQDHKRLLDNDQGPNTGGMGVVAPSPGLPAGLSEWALAHVLQPTVDGLRAEGTPFIGTLYAGLILTASGPQVLEFNCRFGDPETQAILPMLAGDLLAILAACAQGRLGQLDSPVAWLPGSCVCVILASAGYPGQYRRGYPISGLEALPEGVLVFQAGTRRRDGQLQTAGGRVLGVTARGSSLAEARQLAYAGVSAVHFEGQQYRQDIGACPPEAGLL